MAVFTLSDLHLALSVNKPMDIFGTSWHNYMEKIRDNWNEVVSAGDLVIIGGDVSWATYLDELEEDFSFLDSLPGEKLLFKGNHDYWWESITKMRRFVSEKEFSTLRFIHNDAFLCENFLIAGTRGWILPDMDGFRSDDRKIYERELIRLEISLEAAKKLGEKSGRSDITTIAVFHYPPVNFPQVKPDEGIIAILKKYDVKKCIYGHLHGPKLKTVFNGICDGVEFICSSADYLGFRPYKIDFP